MTKIALQRRLIPVACQNAIYHQEFSPRDVAENLRQVTKYGVANGQVDYQKQPVVVFSQYNSFRRVTKQGISLALNTALWKLFLLYKATTTPCDCKPNPPHRNSAHESVCAAQVLSREGRAFSENTPCTK